ncbi:MAG TPA: hypothetical protein PLG58_07465 [Flexilinea sp.]|nr:hypothetical protein [Flexilinea sp.]
MTCKRFVSWVLALAVLAGLGGCGRQLQSGMTGSGVLEESSVVSTISSEDVLSEAVSSSVSYPTLSFPAVQDLTEAKLDSGISVFNLSQALGGLRISAICFLEDDLIGVIAFSQEQFQTEGSSHNYLFAVFSVDNLKLLYQKTITPPQNKSLYFYSEWNKTALSYYLGKENFFEIDRNGITPLPEEQFFRFRLSDSSYILEKDNDLILEQNGISKTIFDGVLPVEDEDPEDWHRYFFDCRLSDTRFIYSESGYEISLGAGVYDIETGKTTLLSHKNADGLWVYTYDYDKAILVPDDQMSYSSIGPYLYDDSTRKLTDLNWLNSLKGEVYPKYYLFGNMLASFVDEYRIATTLRFFDLVTRTEIKTIEIPSCYHADEAGIELFAADNFFYMTIKPTAYDDAYLFRIPIEETMN